MRHPLFSLYAKKLAFSVLGLFVFSLQLKDTVSFSVLSTFVLMTALGILIDQIFVQNFYPVTNLEDTELLVKKAGAVFLGCLAFGSFLHFVKDASGFYTGFWYASCTFLGFFANTWHNTALDDHIPSMEETLAERQAFEAKHKQNSDSQYEED